MRVCLCVSVCIAASVSTCWCVLVCPTGLGEPWASVWAGGSPRLKEGLGSVSERASVEARVVWRDESPSARGTEQGGLVKQLRLLLCSWPPGVPSLGPSELR